MATVRKSERKPPSDQAMRIDLNAVLYREGNWWIAHCLQLDLVAEGDTAAAAVRDLGELAEQQLSTAMQEGDLQAVFRPAPFEIWKMYWIATDRPASAKKQPTIDSLTVRELVLT